MHLLHIASFEGNLGDRVNHLAFRPWFSAMFKDEVNWSNFEIRSVFRKEVGFRKGVAEASRAADAIVIGGGGFWELWPEDYWSGTSLDLDPDFLESLGKPVFFNALGVDDGRGIGRHAEKNFGGLLKYLLADTRYLVSVRNDGSVGALRNHFGMSPGSVLESPDHGFFAPDFVANAGAPISGRYVAVSLAQDMPNLRFRGGFNSDGLIAQIAQSIESLVEEANLSFALVPHIYSDLDVYAGLLRILSDKTRRERMTVMPLQTARTTGHHAVDTYRNANLAWTMRFHASALAIGAGVPTIGLLSYPKVRSIFAESSKFQGFGVEVSNGNFANGLVDLSLESLGAIHEEPSLPPNKASQFRQELEIARSAVAESVRLWAKNNLLV